MIRGVWNRETAGSATAIALLPVFAGLVLERGVAVLPVVVLSLGAVAFWQAVFRAARGVPWSAHGAVIALAAGVLAPADAPLWQVLLAVSFGATLGDLVFGGWGRGFLSPGAVALAFLFLSLPNAAPVEAAAYVAIGAALSGLWLLVAGLVAWPILLVAPAAFWAGSALLTAPTALTTAFGTYAFALVFLAADPAAAPATYIGRWIYGALVGVMAALLATGAPAAQAAVFAILLSQIAAPLIDQGAIAIHVRRRERRHG